MKNKVLEILESYLKMDRTELIENIDNKEVWDSLVRVEIIFAIEEEFGIVFEAEELAELVTPQLLTDAVIRKAG